MTPRRKAAPSDLPANMAPFAEYVAAVAAAEALRKGTARRAPAAGPFTLAKACAAGLVACRRTATLWARPELAPTWQTITRALRLGAPPVYDMTAKRTRPAAPAETAFALFIGVEEALTVQPELDANHARAARTLATIARTLGRLAKLIDAPARAEVPALPSAGALALWQRKAEEGARLRAALAKQRARLVTTRRAGLSALALRARWLDAALVRLTDLEPRTRAATVAALLVAAGEAPSARAVTEILRKAS
jgi:hypothetical protein